MLLVATVETTIIMLAYSSANADNPGSLFNGADKQIEYKPGMDVTLKSSSLVRDTPDREWSLVYAIEGRGDSLTKDRQFSASGVKIRENKHSGTAPPTSHPIIEQPFTPERTTSLTTSLPFARGIFGRIRSEDCHINCTNEDLFTHSFCNHNFIPQDENMPFAVKNHTTNTVHNSRDVMQNTSVSETISLPKVCLTGNRIPEFYSPTLPNNVHEKVRVLKKQNPLKRLFARRKGKFDPLTKCQGSQSVLPDAHPDSDRFKQKSSQRTVIIVGKKSPRQVNEQHSDLGYDFGAHSVRKYLTAGERSPTVDERKLILTPSEYILTPSKSCLRPNKHILTLHSEDIVQNVYVNISSNSLQFCPDTVNNTRLKHDVFRELASGKDVSYDTEAEKREDDFTLEEDIYVNCVAVTDPGSSTEDGDNIKAADTIEYCNISGYHCVSNSSDIAYVHGTDVSQAQQTYYTDITQVQYSHMTQLQHVTGSDVFKVQHVPDTSTTQVQFGFDIDMTEIKHVADTDVTQIQLALGTTVIQAQNRSDVTQAQHGFNIGVTEVKHISGINVTEIQQISNCRKMGESNDCATKQQCAFSTDDSNTNILRPTDLLPNVTKLQDILHESPSAQIEVKNVLYSAGTATRTAHYRYGQSVINETGLCNNPYTDGQSLVSERGLCDTPYIDDQSLVSERGLCDTPYTDGQSLVSERGLCDTPYTDGQSLVSERGLCDTPYVDDQSLVSERGLCDTPYTDGQSLVSERGLCDTPYIDDQSLVSERGLCDTPYTDGQSLVSERGLCDTQYTDGQSFVSERGLCDTPYTDGQSLVNERRLCDTPYIDDQSLVSERGLCDTPYTDGQSLVSERGLCDTQYTDGQSLVSERGLCDTPYTDGQSLVNERRLCDTPYIDDQSLVSEKGLCDTPYTDGQSLVNERGLYDTQYTDGQSLVSERGLCDTSYTDGQSLVSERRLCDTQYTDDLSLVKPNNSVHFYQATTSVQQALRGKTIARNFISHVIPPSLKPKPTLLKANYFYSSTSFVNAQTPSYNEETKRECEQSPSDYKETRPEFKQAPSDTPENSLGCSVIDKTKANVGDSFINNKTEARLVDTKMNERSKQRLDKINDTVVEIILDNVKDRTDGAKLNEGNTTAVEAKLDRLLDMVDETILERITDIADETKLDYMPDNAKLYNTIGKDTIDTIIVHNIVNKADDTTVVDDTAGYNEIAIENVMEKKDGIVAAPMINKEDRNLGEEIDHVYDEISEINSKDKSCITSKIFQFPWRRRDKNIDKETEVNKWDNNLTKEEINAKIGKQEADDKLKYAGQEYIMSTSQAARGDGKHSPMTSCKIMGKFPLSVSDTCQDVENSPCCQNYALEMCNRLLQCDEGCSYEHVNVSCCKERVRAGCGEKEVNKTKIRAADSHGYEIPAKHLLSTTTGQAGRGVWMEDGDPNVCGLMTYFPGLKQAEMETNGKTSLCLESRTCIFVDLQLENNQDKGSHIINVDRNTHDHVIEDDDIKVASSLCLSCSVSEGTATMRMTSEKPVRQIPTLENETGADTCKDTCQFMSSLDVDTSKNTDTNAFLSHKVPSTKRSLNAGNFSSERLVDSHIQDDYPRDRAALTIKDVANENSYISDRAMTISPDVVHEDSYPRDLVAVAMPCVENTEKGSSLFQDQVTSAGDLATRCPHVKYYKSSSSEDIPMYNIKLQSQTGTIVSDLEDNVEYDLLPVRNNRISQPTMVVWPSRLPPNARISSEVTLYTQVVKGEPILDSIKAEYAEPWEDGRLNSLAPRLQQYDHNVAATLCDPQQYNSSKGSRFDNLADVNHKVEVSCRPWRYDGADLNSNDTHTLSLLDQIAHSDCSHAATRRKGKCEKSSRAARKRKSSGRRFTFIRRRDSVWIVRASTRALAKLQQKGEFTCDPSNFKVTNEMLQSYADLGYFLVRGFLSNEELSKLRKSVEHDRFFENAFGLSDGEGRKSTFVLWKHPGNDITGMVARCEKVAGTCEKVLGGEVYHYHSKLMTKAARTGGKHIWHQDYGYWYKNGCLFPDMISVFLPIDRCFKENGCLEVLEGSHKCGRIEHVMIGGQTGADLQRVEDIRKKCPHKYIEMEAGDVLFFHCNLLHTSGNNDSDNKRWVLIPCYNKRSNDPVFEHHHPSYTPLMMVPDSAILKCENYDDLSGKIFNNPEEDNTTNFKAN